MLDSFTLFWGGILVLIWLHFGITDTAITAICVGLIGPVWAGVDAALKVKK